MAKKKTSPNKNKVQYPEEVADIARRLSQLPDIDKGQALRQANIPFLQSGWRPVFPTREVLTLVNRAGRLTMLINLVMSLAASRKIAVEDLAVISESQIRQNTINPAIEMINEQISKIEETLNKNRGNHKSAETDTDKTAEVEEKEFESDPDNEEIDEPAEAKAV